MNLLTRIITIILLCISASTSNLLAKRQETVLEETIAVADGITVDLKLEHSQRTYHGHPHFFGWGGGDDKGSLQFVYKSTSYEDSNPFTPIVLKLKNDVFYLVYFDRETDFDKITFRYYRSNLDGKFEEINRDKFPKELAIQNRWLNEDKKEILEKMDPNDYWFRNSLTGKMWLHLSQGHDYYTRKEPTKEFIEEYKRSFINEVKINSNKAVLTTSEAAPPTS